MVRWRLGLALAVLILLPKINAKVDEDDDDDENKEQISKMNHIARRSDDGAGEDDDNDDEDDDNDDDENDDKTFKEDRRSASRGHVPVASRSSRASILMPSIKPNSLSVTKSPKKRPLECYVCAYKAEAPLRACLDPTKFRVHTITCHSFEDKCFTSVVSKGDSYEAVVRGCRTNCVGTPETTCCDQNRCNNQAFAMPLIQPREALTAVESSAKTKSCLPPTILFFVSILLILQTATKVAIV